MDEQNQAPDLKEVAAQEIRDNEGQIFATFEPQASIIGRGKHSAVYKGIWVGKDSFHGRTVTIKVDKRPIIGEKSQLKAVERKKAWLENLTPSSGASFQPSIAEFIGWIPKWTPPSCSYFIMEYIAGKALDRALADNKAPFPQALVLEWAFQLLDTVDYLHQKRYILGDLDTSNIVLTPQNRVCLVDFKYVDETVGDEKLRLQKKVEFFGWYPENDPASESAFKQGVCEDIRHLGETLFELLTGVPPEKTEIVEKWKQLLIDHQVSVSVADVICKAMAPKSEKRYVSAPKMREALQSLPVKDKKAMRQVWSLFLTLAFSAAMLIMGIFASLKGQAQIARYERMTADAQSALIALENGDYSKALSDALDATRTGDDPPCPPEAWSALADVGNAYDYIAGYKPYRSDFELRGRPLDACFSQNGKYVAVLVENAKTRASKRIQIFNVANAEEVAVLTVSGSERSDFLFLDNDRFLYAGETAIHCYSLSAKKDIWDGPIGSADKKIPVNIAVSADGKMAVSLLRSSPFAYLYDAEKIREDGELNNFRQYPLNRPGKSADATPFQNVSMFSEMDLLFALNGNGQYLAVSFSDGGAGLYDLSKSVPEEGYYALFEDDKSDYIHFEGGFYQDYFFYTAASTNQKSEWVGTRGALLRLPEMDTLLTLNRSGSIHMQADENGIYLSVDDCLFRADMENIIWYPLTQADSIIRILYHAAGRLLAVTENELALIYREDGAWKVEIARGAFNIAGLSEEYVFLATRDKTSLSLLRWKSNGAELLAYRTDDETDVDDTYYKHLGAHVRSDGQTVMLFRSTGFRIYHLGDRQRMDADAPDEETPFPSEANLLIYQRGKVLKGDPEQECLKVIYPDWVEFYSAETGELLSDFSRQREDDDYPIFITRSYRVEQANGSTDIYRVKPDGSVKDKPSRSWSGDTLAYASQTGDYLILSFVTKDGKDYSLLFDENLDVIAKLPEPCEALPNGTISLSSDAFSASDELTLVFDDMQGHLLQGPLYNTLEDLRLIAINWRNETG